MTFNGINIGPYRDVYAGGLCKKPKRGWVYFNFKLSELRENKVPLSDKVTIEIDGRQYQCCWAGYSKHGDVVSWMVHDH